MLTRKQQEALLALDDPEIDLAVIDADILRQLIGVGLLLKREDGRYDLTDKGTEECERVLAGQRVPDQANDAHQRVPGTYGATTFRLPGRGRGGAQEATPESSR